MHKKQMKSLDLNPYFYSYRDEGSSQDSLWVPKGFEQSILVKYTGLAMVLPQLFSDDFSLFSSTISASLSKQTILFHLYNLLQAIIALLLPSFKLTIVATQHGPFV